MITIKKWSTVQQFNNHIVTILNMCIADINVRKKYTKKFNGGKNDDRIGKENPTGKY